METLPRLFGVSEASAGWSYQDDLKGEKVPWEGALTDGGGFAGWGEAAAFWTEGLGHEAGMRQAWEH